MRVKGKNMWDGHEKPGNRKAITGFTASSRKALLWLLARLDRRAAKPIFLTLTFDRLTETEPGEAKERLRAFMERLRRRWPDAGALWKLEPQADGTPHFHLFVWGIAFLPWQWVASNWASSVTGDRVTDAPETGTRGDFDMWASRAGGTPRWEAIAAAGTRTEAIKAWRGVMFYAAKYLGKEVHAQWRTPGRFWGVHQRDRIPLALPVEIETTVRARTRFRRILRKWCKARGHGLLGRYGDVDCLQMARALAHAQDDTPSPHNFVTGIGSLGVGASEVFPANE